MNKWAWLFGALLIAVPVGVALSSRKKKRPTYKVSPVEYEGEEEGEEGTAESEEDQERVAPEEDLGDCLVLGGEHSYYKFGKYRVCLTPNQKRTLFDNHLGRKLGCGTFACAYEGAAPDKVVKFTRDAEDVAALLEAQPTGLVPKVFETYQLKSPGHAIGSDKETPVYAMVVEKLQTFTPSERMALEPELDHVYTAVKHHEDPTMICEDRATCSPITRQVAEAAQELQEAGIRWLDIHSGNIGMDKNGNVKVLDLGVTGTQLKEQPQILEGAKRKLAKRRLAGV